MNWNRLLLIIFAVVGLAALGGYTLYDHLEYQEERKVREEVAAKHEFKAGTDERITQAEVGIKEENQTVASVPFEQMGLIPENESGTHHFVAVPTESKPLKLKEVSGTESETMLESEVLESSGRADLGLAQGSEPPMEPLPESTEEEATTAAGEDERASVNLTTVQRSAIALAVEDREPQGVSDRVSVRQRKVYCWIHVKDGKGKNVIIRWVANGKTLWETSLRVGSNDWRTWAYITLRPSMIGQAQADILSEDGQLLKTESFEITG